MIASRVTMLTVRGRVEEHTARARESMATKRRRTIHETAYPRRSGECTPLGPFEAFQRWGRGRDLVGRSV